MRYCKHLWKIGGHFSTFPWARDPPFVVSNFFMTLTDVSDESGRPDTSPNESRRERPMPSAKLSLQPQNAGNPFHEDPTAVVTHEFERDCRSFLSIMSQRGEVCVEFLAYTALGIGLEF